MAANPEDDQFADQAREAIRQAQAAAYQRQARELLAEGEGKVRAGEQ